MIIVKNREMLIPPNEHSIGTTYDTGSEVRTFCIPRINSGIDISGLTFHLDVEMPEDDQDTLILEKTVTDNSIILLWPVTAGQLQHAGVIYVQLRAIDSESTIRWSSFKTPMYVEDHINVPSSWEGALTEIEQMEQAFEQLLEADSGYLAEIVDARKDKDDYSYESVGDAIRGQIAGVHDEVTGLGTTITTTLADYVKITDIVNALNSTATNKPLSAYQGKLLSDAVNTLNSAVTDLNNAIGTINTALNAINGENI